MMTRRHDIDWLRVFATYLLFVFHVAMVFNPAPFYHIRNAELSFGMLILAGFVSLWHMPLFFVLAGWSLLANLEGRASGGLVRERLHRLVLPLVVGCLLFGPVIKYIELSSGLDAGPAGLRVREDLQAGFKLLIPSGLPTAPPFDEGFLKFLPSFFTLERFTWMHLWFLAYLFTFTILYLPLFSRLARQEKAAEPRAPVGALHVYAPIVLLALIQMTLRPYWPGLQNLFDDWANFAYYSTFLWLGFLLARYPDFEQAVHREWKRALAIGLGTCAVLLVSMLGILEWQALRLAGSAIAAWCLIVAFLGIARRYLTFGNRALAYLSESAFPVYILHQAAIVVPGYFLIRLPLGIATKYLLLLVTSVAVTMAAYHFLVRPLAVPRLLFGMKRRPKPRPQLGATARAA